MPLPPDLMRHPGLMKPPGAAGPMDQPDEEGAEDVSPEMVKAGVACLKSNKGMKPAELVAAIYQAMEAAEDGGEAEGDEPPAGPA